MATFTATVQTGKVSGTNSNFPAYIDLSTLPIAFWNTISASGGDIRVYTDETLTTEIPREVVSCDTATDTGELWCKVGSMTSSTQVWITVDGTSADYAVTATYGRNAVWSDYAGVWHLSESSGNATDSTGGGATGTNTGMTFSAAKIGNGGVSDAGSDNFYFGNPTSLQVSGAHTISFWLKAAAPADLRAIVCKGGLNSASDLNVVFNKYSAGNLSYLISNGTSLSSVNITDANADADFLNDTLNYVSLVYVPSTSLTVYKNGSSYQTNTTSILSSISTTKGMSVGQITTSQSGTARDGIIGTTDELRFRDSALSSNWLTTEYNNQNSPSTFYTVTDASTNYNLIAALGTFTLSGIASGLSVGKKLTAALGSFSLTGIASTLTPQRKPTITADSPADTANVGTTLPTFCFTGTDLDGDDVRYQIQIDTLNTFDGN